MKVYSVADHIISPLGFGTSGNFSALHQGRTGIRQLSDERLSPEPVYAAHVSTKSINESFGTEQEYTLLEKMLIMSVREVLETVPGIDKKKLLLIVSTTKGNIDLIDPKHQGAIGERLALPAMARAVNACFQFPNDPLIVSNACISGSSAIIIGQKLIRMGKYDHVLIAGGDVLSEFTLSGFQCLKAISDEPCRPYDAERKGITLGEASGSMLISKDPGLCSDPKSLSLIAGGGQANDANHISGPSRTGKGLKIAINQALKAAGLTAANVDYINAHGTATLFNDEMESVAFQALGMEGIPLNSLKGYFGHTLGAAGLIESIIAIRQLNENVLLKSPGYAQSGVTHELNVLKENKPNQQLSRVMKTVSGFGGCNAALLFEKDGSAYISA